MIRALMTLLALCLAACTNLSGEPEIVATLPPETETSSWNPDIDSGARIYAEHCAQCHGDSGDGMGSLVIAGSVERPLDFTDHALVAKKSPLDFYEIITEGNLDKLMPPWQDALTERQRWDVALYAYTLGYVESLLAAGEALWTQHCPDCEMPAVIPPVYGDAAFGAQLDFADALNMSEQAAVAAFLRANTLQSTTISVRGALENGTAGGSVPPDTIVQLQYGSLARGFSLMESPIDADSRFRFDAAPFADDISYALSAVYGGRLFSLRLPVDALADDHRLTIYDAASDPLAIHVSRIVMRIDALRLDDLGAGLAVEQVIGYRNESDRIYTSGRGFEDGREASLLAQLPRGARLLSQPDAARFVVIEDMAELPDSLIDTLPVPPGDRHEIALAYFLPWNGSLRFDQTFNNLLDADVRVILPRSLRIDGALQLASETSDAREYSGKLAAATEPALRFTITGDPFATSSDDAQVITSEALLPILFGAAIVLAIAGGMAFLWRRRQPEGDSFDAVTADLAQLERDHDQGRINHDLYHYRRRELQAKLDALRDSET